MKTFLYDRTNISAKCRGERGELGQGRTGTLDQIQRLLDQSQEQSKFYAVLTWVSLLHFRERATSTHVSTESKIKF